MSSSKILTSGARAATVAVAERVAGSRMRFRARFAVSVALGLGLSTVAAPAGAMELNGHGCIVTNTTVTTQLVSPVEARGFADLDGNGDDDVFVTTVVTGAESVGRNGVQQGTLSHTFLFLDTGAVVATSDRAVIRLTDTTLEVRTQSDIVSGGTGHLAYVTSADLATGTVTTLVEGVLCRA